MRRQVGLGLLEISLTTALHSPLPLPTPLDKPIRGAVAEWSKALPC